MIKHVIDGIRISSPDVIMAKTETDPKPIKGSYICAHFTIRISFSMIPHQGQACDYSEFKSRSLLPYLPPTPTVYPI